MSSETAPIYRTREETDSFYRRLWSTGDWSGAPNMDELDRFAAIDAMIKAAHTRGLGERGPLRVLDVGCGRGWLTDQLKGVGHVLGIDPTPGSIDAARKLFPENRFECETTEDLARRIPASEHFDLIVCSEVIEHVPDGSKKQFVCSLESLLKLRGFLILTTPRGELWRAWLKLRLPQQPVEEWMTEEDLSRLFENTSLRLVRRDRAHVIRRPVSGAGWVYSRFVNRKIARSLVPDRVKRWFEYCAMFYQVILLERDL